MIILIYKLLKIIFNVTIKMVLIVLIFNYIILPCIDNLANDTSVPTDECVSSYEENMELFPPDQCGICDYECKCN